MKQALQKPKFWILSVLLLLAFNFIKPMGEYLLIGRATRGDLHGVRLLLSLGVDPNTRSTDAGDAVTSAAWNGDTKIVNLLLAYGANPNSSINEGETALAYAAGNGHLNTVKLLLAHGADPNSGCLELTPLIYARSMKYAEIVALLKSHGAKE